jgi:hypothetical protein
VARETGREKVIAARAEYPGTAASSRAIASRTAAPDA